MQVKGDLMEFATTLGFVAFGSVYNPCIFCSCPTDLIHSYGGLNLAEDVWPDPVDYHAEVIQCEIRIRIDSALDIRRILEEGGLYWDRRTNGARGRALARDMPGLVGACGRSLRAGDRLSPTPSMPDVANLRYQTVPTVLVFWRRRLEIGTGVIMNSISFRNPLFDDVNPRDLLHLDTLHTFYLGPAKHYVAHVFWRAMDANLYGF